MRVLAIHERSVPISRHQDPVLPSGGLTTSIVAIETDATRDGRTVVGYGFASIGRFAQGGLIRERFAPRLLAADPRDYTDGDGNLDPSRAWTVMMRGEKPGGHGERCVAVGTLDMALWDAAAKAGGLPLHRFLAESLGGRARPMPAVPVYAGGGYPYPQDDVARLGDEMRRLADLGYSRAKIKIGSAPLAQDVKRIDAAQRALPRGGALAVDAMNGYALDEALEAAAALSPLGLWWLEDVCDPLAFDELSAVAAAYPRPIAAGEALFSVAEAKLLDQHGGLRRDRDILLFDPAHCYGLPGYLRIVEALEASGWPRAAFWPHGGHLFTLHVAAALGLGGAEVNPMCFRPFGGLSDGASPMGGRAAPPESAGIGFETRAELAALFRSLG